MRFSPIEKRDLFFAGVMISLAFAILLSGGLTGIFSLNVGILIAFVISFFTAGLGFLLHELMHKFVAQSYGLFAEFKAYYDGLWLALAFSLFGFILAAPGAVYIRGWNPREKSATFKLRSSSLGFFPGLTKPNASPSLRRQEGFVICACADNIYETNSV